MEHKDITDPNIHDMKGVSSASNGTVPVASGGASVWVNPYTLVTTKETVVFSGSQAASQPVTTNDVAQNVIFGGAQTTTDANIDAAGVVTINTTNFYKFKFNFNLGRTTAAGQAYIFLRLIINGVATGFVQGVQLDSASQSIPLQIDYDAYLTAGTTVKVEMYRDSAGVANGGLVALTTTALAGWSDTPSAWIRLYKVQGATS